MSKDKTHYRKAFNSPYLSSADIVEPTTLTIDHVYLELDKSKKSKDVFNTAYFTAKELRPGEPLKPMILNACNSKMMKTITGSPFLDDWNGVAVTVYVDPNVKFGRETVEGLRIMKAEPQAAPATDDQLQIIEGFKTDEMLSAARLGWLEQHEPLNTVQAANFITAVQGGS